MGFHAYLGSGDVHTPFNWVWADSATRLAQSVVSSDINKLGLQEDTNEIYYLKDTIPTWVLVGGGSIVTYLNDLADVSVPSPNDGDVLQYNSGSGAWVNSALPAGVSDLDDLSDVDVSGVQPGEMWAYNYGANEWQPTSGVTNKNIRENTALTNQVATVVSLLHRSSGTPTDGFGTGLSFQADDSINTLQEIGKIEFVWEFSYNTASFKVHGHDNGNFYELGVIRPSGGQTSTNGGLRGLGAVDLQVVRYNSTEIAAAAYSALLAGRGNTNNSKYGAIIGGQTNVIYDAKNSFMIGGTSNIVYNTANYSFLGPGENNKILAGAEHSTIISGADNQIEISQSIILGGLTNRILNQPYSFIGNGQNHIIGSYSAAYGTILNGSANQIVGVYGAGSNYATILNGANHQIGDSPFGVILNGQAHTIVDSNYVNILNGVAHGVSESYATVLNGNRVVADKFGQVAANSGFFTAAGDSQGTIQMVARAQVTHATNAWAQLYLDGSTKLITIATNSIWAFRVLLSGGDSGLTNRFAYEITGAISNVGGTTSLLASTVTTIYEDIATFGARVTADDTNDALLIEVQDSAGGGNTIRWVATIQTSELKYN